MVVKVVTVSVLVSDSTELGGWLGDDMIWLVDPVCTGDELICVELIGDELIGDEIIGEELIGDELTGDELVGEPELMLALEDTEFPALEDTELPALEGEEFALAWEAER